MSNEERRKLFIYDKKEVGVLILLGIGVALFAFTMGVHLGKQVSPKPIEVVTDHAVSPPIDPAPQGAPNRIEVSEEQKHVETAVEETLDQSLRDEVAKTGLQVEQPKPLELPTETKPVVKKNEKKAAQVKAEQPKGPAEGAFTLQVGSYPSTSEAEPELKKLKSKGLGAEVREVEVPGKGKWFRLYVGQFPTVKDAEATGKNYKTEKLIRDFVVVKVPNTSRDGG